MDNLLSDGQAFASFNLNSPFVCLHEALAVPIQGVSTNRWRLDQIISASDGKSMQTLQKAFRST